MEDSIRHKRELGRLGEDIACDWLSAHGHTVLRRNYRSGHLEIDIVSIDKDGIHFVEVKTRRFSVQAPPQESVNRTKQQNIVKAAARFLRSKAGLPYGEMECMFDVFAITFNKDSTTTEWIPQAYIPIYK